MAWSSRDWASRTEPSAARAIRVRASGSICAPSRLGDPGQVGDDHLRLDPAQVEALAAGEDGHRHLADLGGGEDELGVGRRLLQGLQQGVEGRRGQHVHFVDDIDLVARLGGGVAHPVEQLAHLVDLAAAGGVELQHIQVPALDDGAAVAALHGQVGDAGLVDRVALIVERARQKAGGGGLAHAAHPGEHEGVGDAARWRRRCVRVRTMASWPIRSSKVRGRYLRARTV